MDHQNENSKIPSGSVSSRKVRHWKLMKLSIHISIKNFLFHRNSPGKSSIYHQTSCCKWFPACVENHPLWGHCFCSNRSTKVLEILVFIHSPLQHRYIPYKHKQIGTKTGIPFHQYCKFLTVKTVNILHAGTSHWTNPSSPPWHPIHYMFTYTSQQALTQPHLMIHNAMNNGWAGLSYTKLHWVKMGESRKVVVSKIWLLSTLNGPINY